MRLHKFGRAPLLDLANAEYNLRKSIPDVPASRRFDLKAAMSGRFQGLFELSRTSELLGQPAAARFYDVLRLSLGWIISILIGKKARERF